MRKLILFLAVLTLNLVHADSPLTSTDFSGAYKNEKILIRTAENKLDKKVLKFLSKEKKSSVLKIAIISQLGWGEEDKYLQLFEAHLLEKHPALQESTFDELRKIGLEEFEETNQTLLLSADDLMCWAFFQGLANYFEPTLAFAAANIAYSRKPESMAHAAVYGLITAQIFFDYDWCMVYQTGDKIFRKSTYTENNLNQDAINLIMNYLSLYQGDCK